MKKMKIRFFPKLTALFFMGWLFFPPVPGALASTWFVSSGIGGNPNLGIYQDFGLRLSTPEADFTLQYREFGSFLYSSFYWVRWEAQKPVFSSSLEFSAGLLAGVSLDGGMETVLAPQAGLFAQWRFWGDLGLVSRLDNSFYSDSMLSELEAGLHLDHFLFKPLSFTALFPAFADVSFTGQPTGWTWGAASVGLEWELE
jgi:hypothetical protein